MSNPTNTPDEARPTPASTTNPITDMPTTGSPAASSRGTAPTRPLTGPSLVLPALVTPVLDQPIADSGAAPATASARATPSTTADAPTQPGPHPLPTVPFVWEQPAASNRHRPRFATILWGALLLGFAVFMIAWTLFPGTLDPTLWLLAAVIGVGLVLVIAGIAAATRRSD